MATSLEREMNSPSGPTLVVCIDGETASPSVGGTWERPKMESGEERPHLVRHFVRQH